jgi:hypothetical protein
VIELILEPHWRSIAAVNPGHKIQEDITKTRVQRFKGYSMRPLLERIDRRNSGRYPLNVVVEEHLVRSDYD